MRTKVFCVAVAVLGIVGIVVTLVPANRRTDALRKRIRLGTALEPQPGYDRRGALLDASEPQTPSRSFAVATSRAGLRLDFPRPDAENVRFETRLAEARSGDGALPIAEAAPWEETSIGVRARRGFVTEEYRYEKHRVEQVFHLEERPALPGPVVLRVDARTNLSGAVLPDPRRNGLWFTDRAGNFVLSYHGATAIDAHGRSERLMPRWEADSIVLEVPASFVETASFPLTVDPWIELAGSGSAPGIGTAYVNNGLSMDLDSSGRPTVAWISGNGAVFLQRWTGAAWEQLAGSASGGGVSNAPSSDGASPRVALDSTGKPVVAWGENGVGIYLKRWNGTSWVEVGGSATGTGVGASNAVWYPALALDSTGNPVVAWSQSVSGTYQIYVKRWNGSAWVEIGSSASGMGISNLANDVCYGTSLALDSSDRPVVSWYTNNYEIYLRRWNGSAWAELAGSGGGTGISSNAGISWNPSLAIDPSDRPVVAWEDNTSGKYQVYLKRWSGTAWVDDDSATAGGISQSPVGAYSPSLALDDLGNASVAWAQVPVASGDLEAYLRRWDGSAWVGMDSSDTGGGISNDSTWSVYPAVALDSSNTPVVAWIDDASGAVLLRRLSASSLTATVSPSGTTTAVSPIAFTITFSQPVTGLATSEILVTNGTLSSLTGSGASYTASVAPAAPGVVTCQVIANAAQDGAGNGNAASNIASVTYAPNSPPTVSSPSPASGTWVADQTPTLTVAVTAPEFNEQVWGEFSIDGGPFVVGASVLTSGGSSYTTGTLTQGAHTWKARAKDATGLVSAETAPVTIYVDTVSPVAEELLINNNQWLTNSVNVSLSIYAQDGTGVGGIQMRFSNDGTNWSAWETLASTKSWSLASGDGTKTVYMQVRDVLGNTSGAITDTIVLDTAPPGVTVTSGGSATSASPIVFTIVFTDVVTGIATSELVVTNGTVSSLTGSGANYTASVTPGGPGTVTCQVSANAAQDGAGNGNSPSNVASILYDSGAPAVAILPPGPATGASPIPFAITFTESVSGFTPSGLVAANGTVSSLTGSGANYVAFVTPGGQGAVTLQVLANAAQDGAGNGNLASTLASIAYDSVSPTVSVSTNGTPTSVSPILFTIVFSEDVTDLVIFDLVVTNGTVGTLTGSAANYTASVTPAGQGAVTCKVAANAAQDGAGNNNAASNAASVTYDSIIPPAPQLLSPANGAQLSGSQVTFVWSSVIDPSGVTYEIQASTSPAFGPSIWSPPPVAGTQAATTLPGGNYSWRVRAVDGVGNAGAWSTVFTFTLPLSILGGPLAPTNVGSSYSYSLLSGGGTSPLFFAVTGGALPPGLSLSPLTGIISGSPTLPGSYAFTVTVTDSSNPAVSSSASFTMIVEGPAAPLTIDPIGTLPAAFSGLTFAHLFSASGGKAPYAWSLAAGTLPAGLTLSPATGLLSGISTQTGSFPITILVTDGSGAIASASGSVTVEPFVGDNLGILSGYSVSAGFTVLPTVVLATPFSSTLFAVGNGTSWSVTSGTLPPGLVLNPVTGRISGTPQQAGLYRFVAALYDGAGFAYRAFQIATAPNGGAAPAILSRVLSTLTFETPFSFSFTAAGGSTAYAWSLLDGTLPPGLQLDLATGELVGVPTSKGSWTFTIRVTDASSPAQFGDRSFRLTAIGGSVAGDTSGDNGSEGGGGSCGCVGWEAILILALLFLIRNVTKRAA